MATVVNMHDAKSSLSRLVKRAASGEVIMIAKNGKPTARLTHCSYARERAAVRRIAKNGKPMARLTRLWNRKPIALIGAFAGKLHMAEDFDAITAEFEPYL